MKGKYENSQHIKIGGFLTEFGALDNSTGAAEEIDRITGLADEHFQSWSFWQYKYYNDITTAAPEPDVEGFWNQ